MTEFKFLQYKVENKVGMLTINRPDALNSLNKQVIQEMRAFFTELESKREIRALIITGAEKSFVAGADIKEMELMTPAMGRELSLTGQGLMQKIEDLPIPTIAAVNGFALGGGLELALSCDFMIASEKAKWGLPEVTLGLIPGYGGTQRLSRCVGKAIAKRVALSGEIFKADQGLQWGLFTQVVKPEELLPAAQKVAETLALRAPLAMAWVKEAVHKGLDYTQSEGMKIETELFARTFETNDRKEGKAAFFQKREPQFSGS